MKINFMSRIISLFILSFVLLVFQPGVSYTQTSKIGEVSDRGAMLRSFVIPGWGHYYVNPDSWNTGRIYLGTDIVLISAYFGFNANANRLDNNLRSFAMQYAGTDISRFGRSYRLNVGDFSSIDQYNDFQERSRNWDRIYIDVNQYYWNWESDQKRREFIQLNNRVDRSRQQLPALFSLMVVNRVISGIHAYNAARSHGDQRQGRAALYLSQPVISEGTGYQATVLIRF
jgi:hypothetical protein